MKNLQTFENFSTNLNIKVTPDQVKKMEREMGEWIIDVCDISLELNDIEDEVFKSYLKMKVPMENWFKDHYPETYSNFIKQIKDQYGYHDISEYIHNLHTETEGGRSGLSDDEYYQMCADIYNLHPGFQRFFQAKFKEYEL